MNDKEFFGYSIQIFESYAFKNKVVNKSNFNEDFWKTAAEKIKYVVSQNPKIIILYKLIFANNQIVKEDLLNLMFTTTCKSKAALKKIAQNPDDWGRSLLWPLYETDLVNVKEWASQEIIQRIEESLNLESLTTTFNNTLKETTYTEFPKTYKNIGRYFL